jgi:nucleotide-binding universal stress UspA family protein
MTQTLLVPIDGSAHALRALDWLIQQVPNWKTLPCIHLLTVQPSLHGDISRFVNAAQIQDYHREEGERLLAPAIDRLRAAGITPITHVRVGESAEVIQAFAQEQACDQIIIGTRGHSGLSGLLLGSIATKLAHLSSVPVTLVR